MIELNSFYNFTGLETFDADAYPRRHAVYDRPDGFQIRQEPARGYTCYLLADTALFLGQAPADYCSAGDRFFTANFTYF